MRGAVFVGAYSVPPARPTASHAVTRSSYMYSSTELRLISFYLRGIRQFHANQNKKASPIPKMACRSTRLLGLEMPVIYLLTTKNTILAFTS